MDLEQIKNKALVACKEKYRGFLQSDREIMLMDAVEYMYLHDRFAKVGVYITKGDKEENYIKILEAEDETLLDCLDRYLELVETADLLKDINQAHGKVVQKIKNAETTEEVIDVVRKYLGEDFNAMYGEPVTEKPAE